MARYEFSEGTSNKFWEISVSGKTFTTTYGKIGASGQTTLKTFGSEAEAKKEADKLVAEKVKKGYVLAGAGGAEQEDEEEEQPPAKASKAAKKGAKAAPAAGASASGKPGARYFEFV